MSDRTGRRTFGPTVLVGLLGAGLVALAGSESWAKGAACGNQRLGGTGEGPGATAVALALLAAWGVLLVTRGRVRRAAALVTALLSVGLVPAVFLGAGSAQNSVRDSIAAVGLDCADVQLEAWFWVAVAALPFAVVPALLAVRLVRSWPEMGSKYDAPVGQEPPAKAPEEQENLDLWKAMDEGRDPTA